MRRLALLVAAVLAIGLVAPATPAAAAVNWAWGSNPEVCKFSGCQRTGSVVALWQAILWADGKFASESSIDGQFGNNTHNATVQWQRGHMRNDLSGRVGPNTWTAAYGEIVITYECRGGIWDEFRRAEYRGPSRILQLSMFCSSGRWSFFNPLDDQWWST